MALSQTAQDELRAELAALDTLRKRLDARTEIIRAVLEPFDFSQTTLPFPKSDRQSPAGPSSRPQTEGARGRIAGAGRQSPIDHKFASTGLRAGILEVLREHGPMRAPAIAKILQQTGFKNDSKTPLSTRVYNDCWRMIERGQVENKEGIFAVRAA